MGNLKSKFYLNLKNYLLKEQKSIYSKELIKIVLMSNPAMRDIVIYLNEKGLYKTEELYKKLMIDCNADYLIYR